jgi:hypothetical protein
MDSRPLNGSREGQQRAAGKTSQQHSQPCEICKTSIPGSNRGGASNHKTLSVRHFQISEAPTVAPKSLPSASGPDLPRRGAAHCVIDLVSATSARCRFTGESAASLLDLEIQPGELDGMSGAHLRERAIELKIDVLARLAADARDVGNTNASTCSKLRCGIAVGTDWLECGGRHQLL